MKKIITIATVLMLAFYLPACKTKVKDADIKTSIDKTVAADPDLNGVYVNVKDGIATVTGEVRTEAARSQVEAKLKDIKGVKSVVNNTTVAAPPVVNSTDDALTRGLNDALKDNPKVQASVVDGKIVLKGEITKERWTALKQTLDKLTPKGYDLSGLVIK